MFTSKSQDLTEENSIFDIGLLESKLFLVSPMPDTMYNIQCSLKLAFIYSKYNILDRIQLYSWEDAYL